MVTDYDIRYQDADAEIGRALLDLRQKHELTQAQFVSILAGQIQQTLKFTMRAERKRK